MYIIDQGHTEKLVISYFSDKLFKAHLVYKQKMPRIELIDESQEQLRKTGFNKPSLGLD